MHRSIARRTGRALLAALLAVTGTAVGTAVGAVTAQEPALADTTRFRGVNWADQRDNFVDGVLYVSGLSAADTYASAATVGDRVVGRLYALTGADTVRMPINEPTVAGYWNTYTGAIDQALTKGKVILAYWAATGGRPRDVAAYDRMWDTVVARYAGNSNAYFEVINEPHGYATTDLNNFYNAWLTRHSNVPRGRVILDGAGLAQNVAAVGQDSRLNDTLLAVHDYSFFAGFEDETSWANHIASYIGGYASRTVATEWGGPMGPGSKNGVSYNTIDYNIPSGSFFADYIRGVSGKLRELGVGGVYWPGLRDGDWYSLTKRTGSGANLDLTLTNPSGLNRLQYSWGIGTGGSTTVRIVDTATGRYADGMGRTTAGSDVGQNPAGSGLNQQWVVENSGTYVRIRNQGSGLYLDGMGRTANGSAVGQYPSGTSANQQWTVVTDANNVRVRNRATGLYLDGMGRTANGATVGQYSDSTSANQRWKIVAAS